MAEKVKLSTTEKKVVNLINQTLTGIYDDAVNRRNDIWFPNQGNSQPVSSDIFKNRAATETNTIIKQMSGNLSAEDETSIRQAAAILLNQVASSYERFANGNGTRFGFKSVRSVSETVPIRRTRPLLTAAGWEPTCPDMQGRTIRILCAISSARSILQRIRHLI